LVFIALFPFGQLLRIPVSFLYAFQPLDGVVFLIVLFCFLRKPSFPFFVYTTVFSVFFTFLLGFSQQPALWSQAFLYFFRLAIYLFLPFAFPRIRGPKFILNVFLLWGICITVFWNQRGAGDNRMALRFKEIEVGLANLISGLWGHWLGG
jgi:hypothetical protein